MNFLNRLFGKPNTNEKSIISSSMEELPPLKDPHALPTCIEDFQKQHIKVLRRLNRHPVNDFFSGIMTFEVDIPNFIPILLDLQLIRETTYEETLNFLKVDTLKIILRKCGLKVSGAKNELIERIRQNVSPDIVKSFNEFVPFYVHTQEGAQLVIESYEKFEQKDLFFRNQMVYLIENRQLNEAYRSICKQNAESATPIGLGVDWSQKYHNGIPSDKEKIYNEQLANSSEPHSTALAIYCDISGESYYSISEKQENESASSIHEAKIIRSKQGFYVIKQSYAAIPRVFRQ